MLFAAAYSFGKVPTSQRAPYAAASVEPAAHSGRHAVVSRGLLLGSSVEFHRLRRARSRSMAKGSFGELLKRERELREVSLNELTVKTRVPIRFIEALENEDWKKLPGGVFNRGFVRVIARYLGLSEEHFLSEYDLAHGQHAVIAPPAPPNPIPSPPKW